jgi:glycogen debranching enzyme
MPSQTVKQASVPSANAPPEDPYSIHVTRQAQRPPRSLKHNDTFLVLDAYGDIGALAGGADGLFDSDTRFLSRLDLLVNGMRPLLLGSNVSDDNSLLTVDLTNPDILADERIISEKDTIHIVRSIFLWNKAAYQRIGTLQSRVDAGGSEPHVEVRQ